MGFMGIEVAEEYGGAGLDTLAYVLAVEEISKADASHGVIMSVNNSLYCHGIMKFGTEEQKKKFLQPVASGKSVGAYALTEPMSGSDAGSMRSRAVRDGDFYVLNGRKSWVTSGPVAEYVLTFMMTEPGEETQGHQRLPDRHARNAPGFSRGEEENRSWAFGLLPRASCYSRIAAYPSLGRLGAEGDGFKIAMTVLDAGRIGIASQALGIAEAAYDASVAYAREREAFGQEDRRFPGDRLQDRGHEDSHRGVAAC